MSIPATKRIADAVGLDKDIAYQLRAMNHDWPCSLRFLLKLVQHHPMPTTLADTMADTMMQYEASHFTPIGDFERLRLFLTAVWAAACLDDTRLDEQLFQSWCQEAGVPEDVYLPENTNG